LSFLAENLGACGDLSITHAPIPDHIRIFTNSFGTHIASYFYHSIFIGGSASFFTARNRSKARGENSEEFGGYDRMKRMHSAYAARSNYALAKDPERIIPCPILPVLEGIASGSRALPSLNSDSPRSFDARAIPPFRQVISFSASCGKFRSERRRFTRQSRQLARRVRSDVDKNPAPVLHIPRNVSPVRINFRRVRLARWR